MAAAVFVPPSPHDPFAKMSTSTRRAPLTNIPNATNSPHRLLTNSGSKRSRTIANLQQENEPPQKRIALDKQESKTIPVTPRQRSQATTAEGKVFERGNGESGSTAFQRKLVAARDRSNTSRNSRNGESSKDVENIRQWQKHYRKIFPSFSFYFDSVSDEQKTRYLRVINHLGAREEKFFSKTVTHIVTTRTIPSENVTAKDANASGTADSLAIDEQNQTINPSLLERNANSRALGQNGVGLRRDAPMDILTRGRQMGMKIWAAEKLGRILSSIIEDPTAHGHATRGQAAQVNKVQEDLSQVLKNEKIGATSEREQVSFPRELVPFRGPFVYIHDIDEKVRPTMVREYPKVARRQDGEWPQFRSATVGKCPFIEDPALKKEEQERTKQKALQQQKEASQQPKAESTTISLDANMDPPRRMSPRKALQEVSNPTVKPPAPAAAPAAPPTKLERHSSFPPMPEQPPVHFVQPSQMHLVREPAASGIQRSNMTSAIQSQMISSTAGTGVKTSTSKEVHELKRKVLERSHTGSLSVGSIPSSHRMNELAGVLKNARAPAPQRAAKSKAQEKLGGIQEEADPYADDMAAERAIHAAARKKKATKKDPKPGYCENCRDKYDDFEEHIVSRKHRKFAMTQSNWDELDALLRKLQAP